MPRDALNRLWSTRLGWGPKTWGLDPDASDAQVADAIAAFQVGHDLKVDGVAGPVTFNAHQEETWRTLRPTLAAAGAGMLELAGELAVVAFRLSWLDGVRDPGDAPKIEAMIRGPLGLGWKGYRLFDQNGKRFQWCGAAAMFHWGMVGLSYDARHWWGSSAQRLDALCDYRTFSGHNPVRPNPTPPAGAPRRLQQELGPLSKPEDLGWEPRAGDIALVGDGDPREGDHIVMLDGTRSSAGWLGTFEGNAHGHAPDGSVRRGVVRHRRPIGRVASERYHVRRIIRFAPGDLAP